MPFFADRIKDTTSTTGTGTITLDASPPTGFRAFGTGFAVGDTLTYLIDGGAEWEVGEGVLVTSTTLSRLIVFSSSNAGALVNFSAGAKTVVNTGPADWFDRAPATLERGSRKSPLVSTDFLVAANANFPWQTVAISTGTFTTAPAAGVVDGNHPGVILLRSSTTANSGVQVMTTVTLIRIAGGEVFDLVFRTPAAFTNLIWRFGFGDTATFADNTDGLYFSIGGTGNIVGNTANNATRSATVALTTLAVSTWYHARITVNANATSVQFDVFSDAGTLLGSQSLTTNIPTASGRELGCGGVFTNSGTTAVDIINLDYMAFSIPGRTLQRGALT